jgi:hypothetical protein
MVSSETGLPDGFDPETGRDFYVFAAASEKKVLGSVKLDATMTTTPTAANGVLFVATTSRLYALEKQQGTRRPLQARVPMSCQLSLIGLSVLRSLL